MSGSDITDVVIAFTDRATQVTGRVNGLGDDDTRATVIVFPVDDAQWADFGSNPRRLRMTSAGPDGSYTFLGLPAGEYFVAAVREEDSSNWMSPDALAAFARVARRLSLNDGERKSLALGLSQVPR